MGQTIFTWNLNLALINNEVYILFAHPTLFFSPPRIFFFGQCSRILSTYSQKFVPRVPQMWASCWGGGTAKIKAWGVTDRKGLTKDKIFEPGFSLTRYAQFLLHQYLKLCLLTPWVFFNVFYLFPFEFYSKRIKRIYTAKSIF